LMYSPYIPLGRTGHSAFWNCIFIGMEAVLKYSPETLVFSWPVYVSDDWMNSHLF
jgi:hypothetical protein